MKRIFALILVISMMSIMVVASDNNTLVYEYENITVEFDPETDLPNSDKQRIADNLVAKLNGNAAAPANIICSVIGHNIETYGVTTYQHKILLKMPRCVKHIYNIEVCSRCDYQFEDLLAVVKLYCCPED